MAKGSPLMGTQRGTLGESVLYRANGEQQARARVRSVKNPRSGAQMVQRAINFTVSQAYSEMKDICDHSFQSVPTGLRSMAYFMSANSKKIRSSLQYFGDNQIDADNAFSFNVKGDYTLATNPYVVARGSLPRISYGGFRAADLGILPDDLQHEVLNYAMFPLNSSGLGLLKEGYEGVIDDGLFYGGFRKGDFLTWCGIVRYPNVVGDMEEQHFVYCRFIVDILTGQGGQPRDIWQLQFSRSTFVSNPLFVNFDDKDFVFAPKIDGAYSTAFFKMDKLCGYPSDAEIISGCWIHSRPLGRGRFLRSNAEMELNYVIHKDLKPNWVWENNNVTEAFNSWLGDVEQIGDTAYVLQGGSR